MVAAYEMMVVTPAIQNMMRENKVYRINSSIQTGRKHGMFLLDDHLYRLWKEGLVVKEEVLLRAQNPAELTQKIAKAERGCCTRNEYMAYAGSAAIVRRNTSRRTRSYFAQRKSLTGASVR